MSAMNYIFYVARAWPHPSGGTDGSGICIPMDWGTYNDFMKLNSC